MSPSRRSRISRLEQAVCRSRPGRPRRRPAAPADAASALSTATAFDDGRPVALLCDGAEPVAPPSRPVEAVLAAAHDLPRAMADEGDDEEPGLWAAPAPRVVDVPAVTEPANGTFTAAPAQAPVPAPGPAFVAAAPNQGQDELRNWTVAPPAEADDENNAFAQDVRAILAHAGSLGAPAPTVPLPTATAPPQPSPSPADTTPAGGVGATTAHGVFDQMAPSRYDQGTVALSVDFDRLNRALAREQSGAGAAENPTAGPTGTVLPTVEPPGPAPHSADPSGTAPPPAPAPRDSTATAPFRVTADVPLVPQVAGISCHAAACASVVGWRDNLNPDPAEIAAGSGFWERYAGGRTSAFPDVLDAFGLTVAAVPPTPTPLEIRDLLDRHGPLWIAAAPPSEHSVVIAGISGDGTRSGTLVDIVDPWARGMTAFGMPNPGSTYATGFDDAMTALAGAPGVVVLAHL